MLLPPTLSTRASQATSAVLLKEQQSCSKWTFPLVPKLLLLKETCSSGL